MDIDDLAARKSGRNAMERILKTLAGRESDARSAFTISIALVGVAMTSTFAARLLREPASAELAGYLLALAVLYLLHCSYQVSDARNVARAVTSAMTEGGYTIVKSVDGKLVGVTSNSQDWIKAKIAEDCYPDLESARAIPFTWSPTGMVGAIQLRQKPKGRLTRLTYFGALEDRINALVAAECPDYAADMIKVVETHDWTVRTLDLTQIGEAMIQSSEWLQSAIQFPFDGVLADELEHDPELAAQMADEDCLATFLAEVYAGAERE